MDEKNLDIIYKTLVAEITHNLQHMNQQDVCDWLASLETKFNTELEKRMFYQSIMTACKEYTTCMLTKRQSELINKTFKRLNNGEFPGL